MPPIYTPRQPATSTTLPVRGLRYHLHRWGPEPGQTGGPLLVMVHGWMDVGASFQFLVDELAALDEVDRHGGAGNRQTPDEDRQGGGDDRRGHGGDPGASESGLQAAPAGRGSLADDHASQPRSTQAPTPPRCIIAPDWRGFGLTEGPPQDDYTFADYLGDLDALLDALSPDQPVDLLGHSMGGNVVMSYAGARPHRVRRLINLEGFGLPRTRPSQAPGRLVRWLDALKAPQVLRDYDDAEAVAARLRRTNPRLAEDRARWLELQWAAPGDDGRWHLRADPAHRRPTPLLYQADEVLELWKRITAPLLCVQARHTEAESWWQASYSLAEFHERLRVVPKVRLEILPDCGHMLHHDQPAALARLLSGFLACADAPA